MFAAREKLQDALLLYIKETLCCIETVEYFCDDSSEWVDDRKTAVLKMENLKTSFSKIDLTISHLIQSKRKGGALKEYLKNKLKQLFKESVKEQRAKLEEELTAVLEEQSSGLEKLDCFLKAVEMLAVTSLHVFKEGNPVINLPGEVRLERIQRVIIAAREICPLLLEFKRDARDFFSPKCQRLENLEVMASQLDRYIQITQKMCESLQKSRISMRASTNIQVNLVEDLTDDEIKRMLLHIEHLIDIRMDPNFRLVFLFPEDYCSACIKEFTDLQRTMLPSLESLEKTADKLDCMSKGAKISSVVGSSVGAAGGVLSIVGFALLLVSKCCPQVSLALIIAGMVCSVLSGINRLVTTGAETGVYQKQQRVAKEITHKLLEDVQSLYKVLQKVSPQTDNIKGNLVKMHLSAAKSIFTAGAVGKTVDSIVDFASGIKFTEDLVTSTSMVMAQEGSALRNVPRVAGDIQDIGQAALKGPFVLSKLYGGLLIGLNFLFLVWDIMFVIIDSISLYKGVETKMSQFIRAKAALWRSEIDEWEKTQGSLCTGLMTSGYKKAVLNSQFYF